MIIAQAHIHFLSNSEGSTCVTRTITESIYHALTAPRCIMHNSRNSPVETQRMITDHTVTLDQPHCLHRV